MREIYYKGFTIKEIRKVSFDCENIIYSYSIYYKHSYLGRAMTLDKAKSYIDFVTIESEDYDESNIEWWRCRLCQRLIKKQEITIVYIEETFR